MLVDDVLIKSILDLTHRDPLNFAQKEGERDGYGKGF
jgi:hypothetical protein